MGGGERFAEAHGRVAEARPLGVELAQPRLELVGHLVERPTELGELVSSLDGHTLVELALRDAARGLDEGAERPDDRAALDVREQCDQHERDQQRHEDPSLGGGHRGVDPRLRGQDRQADSRGVGSASDASRR